MYLYQRSYIQRSLTAAHCNVIDLPTPPSDGRGGWSLAMLFNMVYGVGLEVVGIVGAQIISADASVRVYLDSQKNSPAPDIAQFIITFQ